MIKILIINKLKKYNNVSRETLITKMTNPPKKIAKNNKMYIQNNKLVEKKSQILYINIGTTFMSEPGQDRKIAALKTSKCVYHFFIGDNMNKYIMEALKEAKKSIKTDDVPVGAIIVENGIIISKAHNTREKKYKITGHAEINAIEKACIKKKTWHLNECELYTTLEPCKMCLEVIRQARIKKVFYAAKQEKKEEKNLIEMKQIENVENSEEIIKNFFKNKRK